MSSIQERLQLKRGPLDSWNLREQLCLASAVVRSGDQNWMSVSRALKTVGEPNRPPDWYSQKSCAAQYGALLEHVETPKRKKRSSEGAVETPQESIVKRLTQDRIAEIQKSVAELNQQHEQVKNEISEIRNQSTSEERLRELWAAVESAKRAKERETARRAAMLKEREERRARANAFRPPAPAPTSPAGTPAPPPPSSPLLTSLLKSSPVVTTPQHMPHPASVVDTMSPSVNAPTLSMLLEKGSPQHEREKAVESNKHAAIEHIKSQLVQIEHQLKAGSPPPLPVPPVDIDDIEIKAEDVYAFRDVDLHLPVATMHKGARSMDKSPIKKVEPMEVEPDPVEVKMEQLAAEVEQEVDIESETVEVEDMLVEEVPVQEEIPTTPVRVSTPPAPQFKFPTTEIKVIQPEELKVKEEETKQPEVQPKPEPEVAHEESPPEPEVVEEIVEEEAIVDVMEQEEEISEAPQSPLQEVMQQIVQLVEPPDERGDQPVDQQIEQPVDQQIEQPVDQQIEQLLEQMHQAVEKRVEEVAVEKVIELNIQDIPLPPEPDATAEDVESSSPSPEPETPTPELRPEPEATEEETPEVSETEVSVDVTSGDTVEELKKDDDSEDSIPLNQMVAGECGKGDAGRVVEGHQETDDDTPMEVSREEDKDGKKRRDYSRKKKPDSRTCSGSESANEASAPESPSSGDDRQHRLWKKSVMLVYNRLCAHKYASLFVRPITDEEAPGYSVVVKRPMDLTAIRRNIDNGLIRSTSEFQRDVLLMLSNALLYNSSEHSVYSMAKEMHEEAISELSILLAAQAHAGLEPPPRRRRRRRDDPRPQTNKT